MIRVMIVEDIDLFRGALAALLAAEDDIAVVAQLNLEDDLLETARRERPDVVIVDPPRCDNEQLIIPGRLVAELPGCQVLVLTAQLTGEALRLVLSAGLRGFLDKDSPPATLIDSVRRVAAGEWVIDPVLALTALSSKDNPLTPRQRQVLQLAGRGLPSNEIAQRLFLTAGTVRNYLSAAVRRTGANNLIEAYRHAERAGWL